MARTACVLWLSAAVAPLASAAETLSDYGTSPLASPHGTVTRVEFESGTVSLEAGALGYHAYGLAREFKFSEPVWIVAYRTEILDPSGGTVSDDHICHTFLGNSHVMQRDAQDGPLPNMKAVYTDPFTPAVELPEGFAIHVGPGESLQWLPIFNNRAEQSRRVAMRGRIDFVREADLVKEFRELHATLRSVKVPHLYFVPPGRDERQVRFEMPFDGRIHFVGAHVHPYAKSVELFDITRDEAVWRSGAVNDLQGVGAYSNVQGHRVKAWDSFRLTAVYENPTREPVDAMAGVFILYSLDP